MKRWPIILGWPNLLLTVVIASFFTWYFPEGPDIYQPAHLKLSDEILMYFFIPQFLCSGAAEALVGYASWFEGLPLIVLVVWLPALILSLIYARALLGVWNIFQRKYRNRHDAAHGSEGKA